ncbi:Aste57867_2261 [Aphanomyces stellatus]|uniref:Aste57867_2261 protein n=1 Tax=Aphanomyces stellatus TaxID=120398 RepID=A0A485K894_9STRA|nr:hypothetical protein As57867_002256 [Aphanomyces stellatus]VFT79464.1 Aste57867_2261 [Aphanomyces stellatus]
MLTLGLTLGFFKHLVDIHGGRNAFKYLSTADVCKDVVKPYTISTKLSLVDHVQRHHCNGHEFVKPATWFVSHAWGYKYLDVVDALSDFFVELGLEADGVAVWFCMFNNNQHIIDNATQPFQFWVDSFQTALKAIGNVVMVLSPWNNPATLTRTWCVFEIYAAMKNMVRFEVALCKKQKQEFLDDIGDQRSFLNMLATIKSESSRTYVPNDRTGIVELMAKENIGFADLDRVLFDVLEAWMLRVVQNQIEHCSMGDRAKWNFVLGRIWSEKDKPKAKLYMDEAVRIYRDVLEDQDLATWKVLAARACLIEFMDEPREAWEPMFQEALERQTNRFGQQNIDTLTIMCELGLAYLNHSAFDLAMPLLETCFEICTTTYGGNNDLSLRAMNGLGIGYFYQNQLKQAEVWWVRCYDRRRHLLGDDHPSTISTANNLSVVYSKQGKFLLGAAICENVYLSRQRTFGPTDDRTWIIYENFGIMLQFQGKYTRAMNIFLECIAAATIYNHSKQRIANCNLSLGRLHLCNLELDSSKRLLAQAHATFKALNGPTHRMTLIALHWCYLHALISGGFDSLSSIEMWEQELKQANWFHDTFTDFLCVGCYHPIQGKYITCVKCPKHAWRFCQPCVTDGKHTTFCFHGVDNLEALKPPARHLLEKGLEIMAKDGNHPRGQGEYEAKYQDYQEYCDKNQVPHEERFIKEESTRRPMRSKSHFRAKSNPKQRRKIKRSVRRNN